MCTKIKLLLSICCCLLMCNVGYSKTYYVSTTGNNGNTGLSLAAALLTIQAAANKVLTGDSVLIADGNYAGFDYRAASGTPGDPIVFKSIGTGAVITSKGPLRFDGINIEGTSGDEIKYIEINGLKVIGLGTSGNGIRLVFADHCIVRNCTSDNNGRGIFTGFTDYLLLEYNICSNSQSEHGIYVSNSSDSVVVRYNISFNNIRIGIHMNGDESQGEDGINHSPMIYGNRIYNNNLGAGINLDGIYNPMIFNNLIYNNHNANAIIMFQIDGGIVSNTGKIFNNTIVVPTDGRWGIILQPGAEIGTEIYNNIILNLHSFRGCIGLLGTSGLMSDYNILQNKMSIDIDDSTIPFTTWQGYGFDAHSYSVTNAQIPALFSDYASNDFHLTSSSLAKDKGTSIVNGLVINDFEGNLRPIGSSYDIGAYEYSPPLAVADISTFQVQSLGSGVALSWQTKVEEDGAKFEIERSQNGESFEKILGIKASRNLIHYAAIDAQPLQGINYYRIKTISQDGSIKLSNIQSIEVHAFDIHIFPNPNNGEFYIDKPELIKKINVFDAAGRLCFTQSQVNEKVTTELPAGTYFVALIGDGFEQKVQMMVK